MSLARELLYFVSSSGLCGPYPMLPVNQEICLGVTDGASTTRWFGSIAAE